MPGLHRLDLARPHVDGVRAEPLVHDPLLPRHEAQIGRGVDLQLAVRVDHAGALLVGVHLTLQDG